MDILRKQIDFFLNKFSSKKDLFEKKINNLFKSEDLKRYKESSRLFEILKKDAQDLKNPNLDHKTLKLKFKEFKKAYKDLNELSKSVARQWTEAIIFAGLFVFVIRTFVFGLYHVPSGSAEPNLLVGDRIFGNKMRYYYSDIKRGDYIIFDNPEFIYNKSNALNYYWQKYVGFPIPLLGLGSGPDNIVKRVIAIPGDTIEGKIEDGKPVLYLNGKKLDETEYVNPYPLILLKKTTGFLESDSILRLIPLASFLQKNYKNVRYTYDPNFSTEEQPYYYIKESEIERPFKNKPMFYQPFTPTYEHTATGAEGGRCVDQFEAIKIPEGKYWAMGDSRKNSKDSRFFLFVDKNLIHGRASFIIYSIDSEEPLWLFELIKHPIDFWTKYVRWNRTLKWVKNLEIKSEKDEQK